MSKKVLIAAPVHPILTEGLKQAGYELLLMENINQEEGLKAIAACVGVVTSTRLQLNKEMIDAAPLLQFIGRMGSGMEVIDVPYALSKGIKCIASPEGNCNAVAEHALGMLLSLNKNILKSHQEIEQGQWLREENRGMELEGKTIGIIGYGHTGAAFAKLLSGFDVQVLVYDKYKQIQANPMIEVCSSLEEIYQRAEILSLHVPFQQDTYHMVDDSFVSKMKHPFILLNTSRGTVVDNAQIIKWIQQGMLKGVALDVWEEEPINKMSNVYRKMLNDLVTYPNVLLTAHIAGYSHEALHKMSKILLERITQ